ncbi:molybdopterin-dependent oxidoreductase [Chloroflexota bacterium]
MKVKITGLLLIILIVFTSLIPSCGLYVDEGEEGEEDYSYLIKADPAKVDNADIPVTPIEELGITGEPQEINIDEYRLVVDGLVETPLSLTYEEVTRYPKVTEKVLCICLGLFANNAVWTGVPVGILLEGAGAENDTYVVFHGADGYRRFIDISYIEESSVFLAYRVNVQVLPDAHGFPLRVVVEGDYGNEWVKWLERIEVK